MSHVMWHRERNNAGIAASVTRPGCVQLIWILAARHVSVALALKRVVSSALSQRSCAESTVVAAAGPALQDTRAVIVIRKIFQKGWHRLGSQVRHQLRGELNSDGARPASSRQPEEETAVHSLHRSRQAQCRTSRAQNRQQSTSARSTRGTFHRSHIPVPDTSSCPLRQHFQQPQPHLPRRPPLFPAPPPEPPPTSGPLTSATALTTPLHAC
eukprot:jgi/Ulvmu1/1660/UM114_0030.1